MEDQAALSFAEEKAAILGEHAGISWDRFVQ
jgi:hypothetical protein